MGILFFQRRDARYLDKWSRFFADLRTKAKGLQQHGPQLPAEDFDPAGTQYAWEADKFYEYADKQANHLFDEKYTYKQTGKADVEVPPERFQLLHYGKLTPADQARIASHKKAVAEGTFQFNIAEKILRRRREQYIQKAAARFVQQLIDVARGPNKRLHLMRLLVANSRWISKRDADNDVLRHDFTIFIDALADAMSNMPIQYASRIKHCFESLAEHPLRIDSPTPANNIFSDQEKVPRCLGVVTEYADNADYAFQPEYLRALAAQQQQLDQFKDYVSTIVQKRTRQSSSFMSCAPDRTHYHGTNDMVDCLQDDVDTLVVGLLQVRNFQQTIKLLTPFAHYYSHSEGFIQGVKAKLKMIPSNSLFNRDKLDVLSALERIVNEKVFYDYHTAHLFFDVLTGLGDELGVQINHQSFPSSGAVSMRVVVVERKLMGYVDGKALLTPIASRDTVTQLSNKIQTMIDGWRWGGLIQQFDGLRELELAYASEGMTQRMDGREPLAIYSEILKRQVKAKLPEALLTSLEQLNVQHDTASVPLHLWEAYQVAAQVWAADAAYNVTNDLYEETKVVANNLTKEALELIHRNMSAPNVREVMANAEWLTNRLSQGGRTRFANARDYDLEEAGRYNTATLSLYDAIMNGVVEVYNRRFPENEPLEVVKVARADTPNATPRPAVDLLTKTAGRGIERDRPGSNDSAGSGRSGRSGSLRSLGLTPVPRGEGAAAADAEPVVKQLSF